MGRDGDNLEGKAKKQKVAINSAFWIVLLRAQNRSVRCRDHFRDYLSDNNLQVGGNPDRKGHCAEASHANCHRNQSENHHCYIVEKKNKGGTMLVS